MNKYQYGVIRVCETLHGHFTGSGDPLPFEKYKELVEWLQWRYKNWTWNHKCGVDEKSYDSAVFNLMRAIIDKLDRETMICDCND